MELSATTQTTTPASTVTASTDTAPEPATNATDYTVTDCHTPPVPFALLCDVYGYLDDHHVDAPLDGAALAAGLALGVGGYETGEDVAVVASFECSIPDPVFEPTCRLMADRFGGAAPAIEGAIEAGVASMITLSLDPFTYYIPPELSGGFTADGVVSAVGILLTITDPVGSRCTVVEPPCRLEVVLATQDGPAFQSGLEAGDVINAVGGEPVTGRSLIEVASLLDGASGTSVTVDVAGDDGQVDVLTIARAQPVLPQLEVDSPRPGVGYLRIPDFGPEIPLLVHTGLLALTDSGIDELVLDLRDNPGGLVDVVTLVASEFLGEGLVLRSVGPGGNFDYPVQPGGVATLGPDVTVVVNAGSASAAEILAGVLQERGRATVVGAPTFGKNTVQIGFPLRNGGELRVTIARWVIPEGESIAIDGVIPDLVVDIPVDASTTEVVDLALDS